MFNFAGIGEVIPKIETFIAAVISKIDEIQTEQQRQSDILESIQNQLNEVENHD